MSSSDMETAVASHYGRSGLAEAIVKGLEAMGADLEALRPEDLAPVDEFHTAGRVTTIKALDLTPIRPGMHVLDAGCGIGGTARHLAKERGCKVTGVDITPDYIEVASFLTDRMGLGEDCTFDVRSVLDLPFDDRAFDAVVTFHVAMNIEDRSRFYSELARVLKPGGPLCVFDVMKGPAPGMHYPVPWAETAATSFLKSCDETGDYLRQAGFDVFVEESLKKFATDFFREVFRKTAAAGGPQPLGLHLLTGANSPEKFGNYLKALEADQVEPVIMVALRQE